MTSSNLVITNIIVTLLVGFYCTLDDGELETMTWCDGFEGYQKRGKI